MCILAGCDYLKSFKNFGLKTAYKYVSQHSELKNIICKLKREIGKIPEDYEDQFLKAKYSFKHHLVFCPLKGEMVHLNPIPQEVQGYDMGFLGEHFDRELMIGIARGRVDPFTKIPFNNLSLKRKIDEIFPSVQKLTQARKIKIADEVKTIAQQIRIEKKTQNSKYFDDSTENPDEKDGNCDEETGLLQGCSKLLIQPFKPHVFVKENKELPANNKILPNPFIELLENLQFKRIDLQSIFKGTIN